MSEGLEAIFFLSFSFFLVGSVGDVSRVLLACVLHALGTNPAAVRGFRNRFPRPNFEMMSARFQTSVPGYIPDEHTFLFFLFSGFRRRRFESFIGLCVLHALGTNPAAVRGFRNRFPKPNFEMMSARFQTSVPGYSRIVSCDVGRPGGYLFSFLFFLFSGFRIGDVSRVLLACVLHALGTNPAAVRGFRNRFPKPNFEMMSARFQTSVPSFSVFLVGSVGDVSRVLLACVLHALGTNPAAVRGFRNRFPKPNFEMMSARFQTSVPSFSFFLVGSVGDVSRVLLACVLHALGTNPAAVRGFRNRFPKPNFEMMSARFQTSVPGYSRIVSCDVGRPGGYLFSFLFFLFSGFRRRRFDSFIGLCFACLGHESCCCSRLSQPFSKAKFRDDVGAIPDERTWL